MHPEERGKQFAMQKDLAQRTSQASKDVKNVQGGTEPQAKTRQHVHTGSNKGYHKSEVHKRI